MFRFSVESLIPLLIFSIPIIAIVGGITVAIVKSLGRQRLLELAQQERIAAIQRGVDISKLPPLPNAALDDDEAALLGMSVSERDRRRAQGLLIGGIVTLFVGGGIMAFLSIMDQGDEAWAVGIIPAAVGAALLLSAWIVRPKGYRTDSTPRP
jgi:uncharacterized membrane protein YeaQ/YmgE (transglycosylase-associated protein family)